MSYKIDDVFSALADSNRRVILLMLAKKDMSVNSIAEKFNVSRPAISKHLKVLLKTNLVAHEQQGRERFYRLNAEPLKEVRNWLKYYDKFWDEKLHKLKKYLEDN